MTEACKLALAVTLHSRHVKATGVDPFKGVTPRICAHYFFLAVLYTINNQLTFYALEVRHVWRLSRVTVPCHMSCYCPAT
jgi:UDP-sugar transporter A1/2/3